jgi:hypothetical protein
VVASAALQETHFRFRYKNIFFIYIYIYIYIHTRAHTRKQNVKKIGRPKKATYCDVFGRMPPLLCNRKLNTYMDSLASKYCCVAMQPKVKHLHGYARHSSTVAYMLAAWQPIVGRSSVSIGTARYYKGKAIGNS